MGVVMRFAYLRGMDAGKLLSWRQSQLFCPAPFQRGRAAMSPRDHPALTALLCSWLLADQGAIIVEGECIGPLIISRFG